MQELNKTQEKYKDHPLYQIYRFLYDENFKAFTTELTNDCIENDCISLDNKTSFYSLLIQHQRLFMYTDNHVKFFKEREQYSRFIEFMEAFVKFYQQEHRNNNLHSKCQLSIYRIIQDYYKSIDKSIDKSLLSTNEIIRQERIYLIEKLQQPSQKVQPQIVKPPDELIYPIEDQNIFMANVNKYLAEWKNNEQDDLFAHLELDILLYLLPIFYDNPEKLYAALYVIHDYRVDVNAYDIINSQVLHGLFNQNANDIDSIRKFYFHIKTLLPDLYDIANIIKSDVRGYEHLSLTGEQNQQEDKVTKKNIYENMQNFQQKHIKFNLSENLYNVFGIKVIKLFILQNNINLYGIKTQEQIQSCINLLNNQNIFSAILFEENELSSIITSAIQQQDFGIIACIADTLATYDYKEISNIFKKNPIICEIANYTNQSYLKKLYSNKEQFILDIDNMLSNVQPDDLDTINSISYLISSDEITNNDDKIHIAEQIREALLNNTNDPNDINYSTAMTAINNNKIPLQNNTEYIKNNISQIMQTLDTIIINPDMDEVAVLDKYMTDFKKIKILLALKYDGQIDNPYPKNNNECKTYRSQKLKELKELNNQQPVVQKLVVQQPVQLVQQLPQQNINPFQVDINNIDKQIKTLQSELLSNSLDKRLFKFRKIQKMSGLKNLKIALESHNEITIDKINNNEITIDKINNIANKPSVCSGFFKKWFFTNRTEKIINDIRNKLPKK